MIYNTAVSLFASLYAAIIIPFEGAKSFLQFSHSSIFRDIEHRI